MNEKYEYKQNKDNTVSYYILFIKKKFSKIN